MKEKNNQKTFDRLSITLPIGLADEAKEVQHEMLGFSNLSGLIANNLIRWISQVKKESDAIKNQQFINVYKERSVQHNMDVEQDNQTNDYRSKYETDTSTKCREDKYQD